MEHKGRFVVRDVYTWTPKGYEESATIRKKRLDNPADLQGQGYLATINSEAYLLIDEGYSDGFLKGVWSWQNTRKFDKENPLVFSNDKQRIYGINFSK